MNHESQKRVGVPIPAEKPPKKGTPIKSTKMVRIVASVLFTLLVVVFLHFSEGDFDRYLPSGGQTLSPAFRSSFIDGCAEGDVPRAVCECGYNNMVAKLPIREIDRLSADVESGRLTGTEGAEYLISRGIFDGCI